MTTAPESLAAERFRELRKIGEKVSRLGKDLAETRQAVTRLQGEQTAAARRDNEAYAAALSEGRGKPSRREEPKVAAELEETQARAEALKLAVDSALDERASLLKTNHPLWRVRAMRDLGKAKGRYENAIVELAAARDSLSDEASLVGWLDGKPGIAAATDSLGGRLGSTPGGRPPLSFSAVVDELQRDVEYLVGHPVSRDDPQPRQRPELLAGVIRTGTEWGGA